ncbi:MAG TPA: DinB family protein [Candidatus Bathyarchaeia archaeon]|nr:DinB family protein [Candidatus Bathyarchaeia archaeon]
MFTISELYSYSSRVRRNFAEKLSELPVDVVVKNREASFYTMKNILVHMIDNEDWIINWVIHGKSREYVRKKSEEYTDMTQVLQHLDEVEGKTRAFLKAASEQEFNRRVDFALSSGKIFNLSVEECLFQSFTEQLYHMGELIALLWQDNIEPPRMQWFWNNPREHPT